ncbi:conserved hypothetical protein [Ricinus communis]|uniref:Uncharacterized protein n=1 Tax=Ricinus communis TaxID=3988 RepID=B9S3Y2_RICCO|nr:conserved hypothetical protein [Ricinus communis]
MEDSTSQASVATSGHKRTMVSSLKSCYLSFMELGTSIYALTCYSICSGQKEPKDLRGSMH